MNTAFAKESDTVIQQQIREWSEGIRTWSGEMFTSDIFWIVIIGSVLALIVSYLCRRTYTQWKCRVENRYLLRQLLKYLLQHQANLISFAKLADGNTRTKFQLTNFEPHAFFTWLNHGKNQRQEEYLAKTIRELETRSIDQTTIDIAGPSDADYMAYASQTAVEVEKIMGLIIERIW